MKRISSLILCICCIICAVLIQSRIIISGKPLSKTEHGSITVSPSASNPGSEGMLSDTDILFTVLINGEVTQHNMYDYLPGVLAAEMPAVFELEALKAQAVAARTYIMYCSLGESLKHPEANVCGNASCCKAYAAEAELREKWGDSYEEYCEKITRAARETNGEYLSYAGAPIQAVFHSSSDSKTEASGALWSSLPYLVSVDSPETAEDVPNFITTVEVTADDFSSTLTAAYPEISLAGEAESWVGISSVYDSGRVAILEIGGIKISGAELRSLFSLRSAAFTLEYLGGNFLFTVRGYGHGVGMSQYGANVMAQSGADYVTILSHYYPGTTLL